MPNISVPGDVEGFGIVAIEAAACGTPVVASDIQGIRDAVIDGETGFLLEERNVAAFVGAIRKGAAFDREMIKKRLSTGTVGKRYILNTTKAYFPEPRTITKGSR